jgi:type VI protein secretion system component VasF
MIDRRRRRQRLEEQRRASVRMALWLALMVLVLMFASMYLFWRRAL